MLIKKLMNFGLAGGLILALASTAEAQELNKLSAAESTAGYDLLWNGTDFTGWHAYRQTTTTDAWTVKTDAPLGQRIQNGPGTKRPILTNKKYMNFDLKLDIQVTVKGNSGVFVRYLELATDFNNSRSGPEMQVCGPSNGDCASETKHFGSCYDMFGVNPIHRTTWYNPPGQWNSLRIVVFDSNYVHYGNGKKLLEYKIGTPEFVKAYNQSKYVSDGNNGKYYDIHAGSILLQHHGEEGMTFRNLRAKELTTHPFKAEFKETGKWPDVLPQDFAFTGTSTGIATKAAPTAMDITYRRVDAGVTQMVVPFKHSGFHVAGIDGRSVPFTKLSDGVYSIGRRGTTSGIVVARLTAGGHALTKIVGTP